MTLTIESLSPLQASGAVTFDQPGTGMVTLDISNLTATGGSWTASSPTGIGGSGAIIVSTFQLGSVMVDVFFSGSCTGGSFSADFAGELRPQVAEGVTGEGETGRQQLGNAASNNVRVQTTEQADTILDMVDASIKGGASQPTSSNGFIPIAHGGRYQGGAAGDGFAFPFGIWASYRFSDFEDDFAATAFDADSHNVMFGADFSPWENYLFGVAVGYETTEFDNTSSAGETDIDGVTVIPYMGALISDPLGVDFDLSMDLAVGFSFLDADTLRTVGGTRITGSTDSDRTFFSGNVTAGKAYGNWYLSGRAGLITARDDADGFTESDGTVNSDIRTDLGQLRLGGEVEYQWGAFSPFVSATYEYDYENEDLGAGHPNDDDDVLVGAGLRYFGDSVSGSVEYSSVLGREDFDSDSISVQIRAEF